MTPYDDTTGGLIPFITVTTNNVGATVPFITVTTDPFENNSRTYAYNNFPEPKESPENRQAKRLALIRLWCWEARQIQFRALMVTESPEKRLGFTREKKPRPVRPRYKKRVCGGANRYRVLIN